MREVLELCMHVDVLAAEVYATMATGTDVPELAETFSTLAAEERSHIEWWRELITAWDKGLVPELVNDTEALTSRLQALHDEVSQAIPKNVGTLSVDEMLSLAARIEFFMIDPVFGELIDLTEPARSEQRHDAYAQHLDRLIGAIEHNYSKDSLVTFLASILSRVWRDNMALAVFATHDPLTGLYNRRALSTHLKQWSAWSARYGRPLTLLLIDVDLFKGINDAFGHTFGDTALTAIANAIDGVTRAADLVVRYGGDEFAVVSPETGAAESAELIDRIITAVRELALVDHRGKRAMITVSVGAAVVSDPPGSAPRGADELLAAADQSLYRAKQTGRDRPGAPVMLSRA